MESTPDACAVEPHAILREIGISSLQLVDIVLDIEEEFGFELTKEQATDDAFRSISTIVSMLEQRSLSAMAGAPGSMSMGDRL